LVRAMYDYESEDATNLTFKKDDVIQVLAQLDSGWWAGHCQGRQGWFPSNYV
ncbi:SH3 domain-containing protein, partial [Linnemannia elongata]